jgi:rRNA-processing protein FCF1
MVLDVSLNSNELSKEVKYNNFDYMVTDLTYYAGVDSQRTAAIMTNDKDLIEKARTVVVGIGAIVQPMDAFMT